jgi:hypothetical protein
MGSPLEKKKCTFEKQNDCTLSMIEVIIPTSEGSWIIVQMKTLFHVLPHGCPTSKCEIMHDLFVSLMVLNNLTMYWFDFTT